MKTFKDITFKQHQLGKGSIQGLLTLDNGIELSVVAGAGAYCTSKGGVREAVDKVEDVSTFEVGIIDENLDKENQEWDVQGWMSREEISKLIQEHAN